MRTKKRDESLIRDFTPYDPFEAGRVMARAKKIEFALKSVLIISVVTILFLSIIYFWPTL